MTLRANLDAITTQLTQRLLQLQFEMTLQAYSKLILMDSPGIVAPVVDTGRYRASWAIGVNTVNATVHPPVPKGADAATIPAPTPLIPTLALGDVVYLTNSLPYANRIERGWSPKAPDGVAGLVAAELRIAFPRLAANIRSGVISGQ